MGVLKSYLYGLLSSPYLDSLMFVFADVQAWRLSACVGCVLLVVGHIIPVHIESCTLDRQGSFAPVYCKMSG
jgi:hypothetical protein